MTENLYQPINFEELSRNNEFKSVIKLNCDLRNYIIITYKDIEKTITELIHAIELELKDKKNNESTTMIKFFRVAQHNFTKQNQSFSWPLVEIAPDSHQNGTIKKM